MKKTRFLALALVVAIALMGAGYAWWTDTINYESTINTGKLEMTLQTATSSYDIFDLNGKETDRGKGRDNVDVIDPILDGNSATFEFKNLYPGVKATTTIRAQNTGTVPVTLKDIEVVTKTTDKGPDNISDLAKNINVVYSLRVRDASGKLQILEIANGQADLPQLQNSINNKLQGQIIYPGEILEFAPADVILDENGQQFFDKFIFWIDRWNNLSGDKGELETVNVKIQFNFIQANEY